MEEKKRSNRGGEEEEKMATKTTVTGKKRRRTVNNLEEEKLRSWSDLPQEILELIKKRPFFAGQLTFPAVCKSWSSIDSFPPPKQIPWLIVLDQTDQNTWSSCKLIDPSLKKTYIIDMKSIKEKNKDFNTMKVHESKYGWLLISSHYIKQIGNRRSPTYSLFLYSPFYNEKNNVIELPGSFVVPMLFTTFTSNPLEEDCLFLMVRENQNQSLISTCRRGDESWIHRYLRRVSPLNKLVGWTYSEGIFAQNYKMGTFDITRNKGSVIPPPTSSSSPTPTPLRKAEKLYILKNDGEEELFLVYAPRAGYKTKKWSHFIQYIYRLDLWSMIWERVKSLDDNMLFIGDGYNSVLKLSEMEMKGISTNTVYYCAGSKLKCCTVDRFHGRHPDDSIHYGSMATKGCIKIFIDPPHQSS